MRAYQMILRDLREDRDLTQEEVAHAIGTSQTMYARYERAASELPVRHLISLAKLYNVSTDYILGTASAMTLSLDGCTEEETRIVFDLLRYFDKQK